MLRRKETQDTERDLCWGLRGSLPSPPPSVPPSLSPLPLLLSLSLPQLFSSGYSKSEPWQAMNQSGLFLLSCENVYNIVKARPVVSRCVHLQKARLVSQVSGESSTAQRALCTGWSVPGGRPPSRPHCAGVARVPAQRAQSYFLATDFVTSGTKS